MRVNAPQLEPEAYYTCHILVLLRTRSVDGG